MERQQNEIYNITQKILVKLASTLETSSGKAMLAKLRNSIGKSIIRTIDIWPLLFEYLPESFLGTDGHLSKEEQAIITTLQLYAIHQQGNSKSILANQEDRFNNIGHSLKSLRIGDDSIAVDRRFNAMITSSTFEELSNHLRHMIRLLKSKSNVQVDYAKLAEDLYQFLRGNREKIRLSWAREYYRYSYKGDDENDE